MKWPWSRGTTIEQQYKIDERLERIARDDEKVERLDRRVKDILRENNLAPAIMRALRLR